MAAEELQKACESAGIQSSRRLRDDLHEAWVAMTVARGFDDVRLSVFDVAAPHVSVPDQIENRWQTTIVMATNSGKADSDVLLDHYAAQLARDRSRFWRERGFAAGGIAVGFVLGHASDVIGWIGGHVHH